MPPRSPSGTRGLMKRHVSGCSNRGTPSRCDCAWRGRYQNREIGLAVWSGTTVDPRQIGPARVVFARLVAAIDGKYFDPTGEVLPLGTDQRFHTLVDEYITAHVETAGLDGTPLTGTGLKSALHIIQTEKAAGICLGALTLEAMVATPDRIKTWLDARKQDRNWKPKTWVYYYGVLYAICEWATLRKTHNVPRMMRNPLKDFAKLKLSKYERIGRVHEDLEDRLFAACQDLNAPLHLPNGRAKLDQAKADEIRRQVATGARQKDIAAAFGVSPAVVCDIVSGRIWNLNKYKPSTKGDEMERRLIGSIDGGMRAGELMEAQLKHVDYRNPYKTETELGKGYVITLPPDKCKGGKTTGQSENIYAGSPRFVAMLDARRAQLIANSERQRLRFKTKQINVGDAYLFGDEQGRKLKGFKRQYRKLFDAAGLVYGVDYGRDLGLVWHTTRHEYCSRIAEQSNGNATTIQEAGRFKDLKTAQIYIHVRNEQVQAASAVVNRRGTGGRGR